MHVEKSPLTKRESVIYYFFTLSQYLYEFDLEYLVANIWKENF